MKLAFFCQLFFFSISLVRGEGPAATSVQAQRLRLTAHEISQAIQDSTRSLSQRISWVSHLGELGGAGLLALTEIAPMLERPDDHPRALLKEIEKVILNFSPEEMRPTSGEAKKLYELSPSSWNSTVDKLAGNILLGAVEAKYKRDGLEKVDQNLSELAPERLAQLASAINRQYPEEVEQKNLLEKLLKRAPPAHKTSLQRELNQVSTSLWRKKKILSQSFEKAQKFEVKDWNLFLAHYSQTEGLTSPSDLDITKLGQKLMSEMREKLSSQSTLYCDINGPLQFYQEGQAYCATGACHSVNTIVEGSATKNLSNLALDLKNNLGQELAGPLGNLQSIFDSLNSPESAAKGMQDLKSFVEALPESLRFSFLSLRDASLSELQKKELQHTYLEVLRNKLTPYIIAQREVSQLFLRYHSAHGLQHQGYPQELLTLLQKKEKEGLSTEPLLLTWMGNRAVYVRRAIDDCVAQNPQGKIEEFLNSGLEFLAPREELISTLLKKTFIPNWMKANWDAGTGSFEELKKTPFYGLLAEDKLREIYELVKERFVMRDQALANYQDIVEAYDYISHFYGPMKTKYDSNKMNPIEKSEFKKLAENYQASLTLKNQFKKFLDGIVKLDPFLNTAQWPQKVQTAGHQGKIQANLKFKKLQNEQLAKMLSEQERNTNVGSIAAGTLVKMVDATSILMGSIGARLVGGKDEAARFILYQQEQMNNTKYGSVLGTPEEFSNMSTAAVWLRIHPLLQGLAGLFQGFDQLVDDIELANIQWQLGVSKDRAKIMIQTNPYLKAGHFFAGVSKFAAGLALSLWTGGSGAVGTNGLRMGAGGVFTAQLKDAFRMTAVVGLMGLAGSGGGEMMMAAREGRPISLKNIAYGTWENTNKSMLFMGTLGAAVGQVGKASTLSLTERIALQKFRAQLMNHIDILEGSGDLPQMFQNITDTWENSKKNGANWQEILGTGLMSFVTLFDLGGDHVASGLYHKVKNAVNLSELNLADDEILNLAEKAFGNEFALGLTPKAKIEKAKALILVLGYAGLPEHQREEAAARSVGLKELTAEQKEALKASLSLPRLDQAELNLTAILDVLTKAFTLDQATKLAALGLAGSHHLYPNTTINMSELEHPERLVVDALIANSHQEIEAGFYGALAGEIGQYTTEHLNKFNRAKQMAEDHAGEADLIIQKLSEVSPAIKQFFENNPVGQVNTLARSYLLHLKKKIMEEESGKVLSAEELKELGQALADSELVQIVNFLQLKMAAAIECYNRSLAQNIFPGQMYACSL